ncbi:MAG: hypothetical protein NC127_06010 [Muribaculum sp.]|nr:hypothetical protein [Muribaculum sp.]
MKKQLFSILVLGMALLPLNSFAQHHGNNKHSNTPCMECPGPQNCENPENCAPGTCEFGPFQGLDLTQEQQAKLKALKDNSAKERKESFKENRRAEKAQSDSLRRADQLNYLHSIKEILTPEQYVQFLENMAINRPAGPNGGKDFRRDDRRVRPDDRRMRPDDRRVDAAKMKKAKRADSSVVIKGSGKKSNE